MVCINYTHCISFQFTFYSCRGSNKSQHNSSLIRGALTFGFILCHCMFQGYQFGYKDFYRVHNERIVYNMCSNNKKKIQKLIDGWLFAQSDVHIFFTFLKIIMNKKEHTRIRLVKYISFLIAILVQYFFIHVSLNIFFVHFYTNFKNEQWSFQLVCLHDYLKGVRIKSLQT